MLLLYLAAVCVDVFVNLHIPIINIYFHGLWMLIFIQISALIYANCKNRKNPQKSKRENLNALYCCLLFRREEEFITLRKNSDCTDVLLGIFLTNFSLSQALNEKLLFLPKYRWKYLQNRLRKKIISIKHYRSNLSEQLLNKHVLLAHIKPWCNFLFYRSSSFSWFQVQNLISSFTLILILFFLPVYSLAFFKIEFIHSKLIINWLTTNKLIYMTDLENKREHVTCEQNRSAATLKLSIKKCLPPKKIDNLFMKIHRTFFLMMSHSRESDHSFVTKNSVEMTLNAFHEVKKRRRGKMGNVLWRKFFFSTFVIYSSDGDQFDYKKERKKCR